MTSLLAKPAIAIGGVGGSGTRAVAAAFAAAGADIGFDLNESNDDLLFTALMKDPAFHPNALDQAVVQHRMALFLKCRARASGIPGSETLNQLTEKVATNLPSPDPSRPWLTNQFQKMRLTTLASLQAQLANKGNSDQRWPTLWKEPNTHVLLPVLLNAMPALRYIHVTRHGLDMAHSGNQNQLQLWGEKLLGHPVDAANPTDCFAYWCAVQNRVLSLQTEFPRQVLVVRLEALAADDAASVEALVTLIAPIMHSQVKTQDMGQAAYEGSDWQARLKHALANSVTLPSSTGRHRQAPVIHITEEQRHTLELSGYSSN